MGGCFEFGGGVVIVLLLLDGSLLLFGEFSVVLCLLLVLL